MHYEKEETIQIYNGWEEFYGDDVSDRLDFFSRNERLFDIIYAQQFDRGFLNYICNLANQIRILAQTKMGSQKLSRLLSHKRAMLYFVQPSTRTFISFLNACHILGMRVSEIRGTSTSSEVKGESQEDTIRTFASYVDLIVIPTHGRRGLSHLLMGKRGGSGCAESALFCQTFLWHEFCETVPCLYWRVVHKVRFFKMGGYHV